LLHFTVLPVADAAPRQDNSPLICGKTDPEFPKWKIITTHWVSRLTPAKMRSRKVYRAGHALPPGPQPGPGADARFKSVTKAYEILSDPAKREEYNQSEPPHHHRRGSGEPIGCGLRHRIPADGTALPPAPLSKEIRKQA
jgi:hypothetical protein